jgi:threonine/homoserine/homoserine lactone efflux protein
MFSLQFFITSFVVVLIPGTGVIYTISTGIIHKTKYSIYAAIGCTLGIIPHLLACILGLSAIMNMSARIFSLLKILGVLYLLYLAIKTWKYAGDSDFSSSNVRKDKFEIIRKGIALNLLNPKLTLFFLSFLPQFIPSTSENIAIPMINLSLVFMVMTLIVFILYGVLASSISALVRKSKRIMRNIERSFSIIFAGLAIKLAFSEK